MPRRKKGRDKPRGGRRRNRKQDLPALNVIPFQRIGEPKRSANGHGRVEPPITVYWEQRIQPQPVSTSLEDSVGLMYMSRKAPKIEKVTLKDFEREERRGKQVIRRRRASSMMTLSFYELQSSKVRLEKYRQYEGEIYFAERQERWYITLVDLLTRIGPFEAELSARTWAQRYLGRKYFKGGRSD